MISLPLSHIDLGAGGKLHLIAQATLSAAASSVAFHFSPMYRLFICETYIVNDASDKDVSITLNGDTGANYDYQYITGSGTAKSAARVTGTAAWLTTTDNDLDATQDYQSTFIVAKSVAGEEAQLLHQVSYQIVGDLIMLELLAGQWSNTADLITRLDIVASSNNFAAGSAFALYGIIL